MASSAPVGRRQRSLDASPWLPTYGWLPRTEEFAVTVVLTTYQAATKARGRLARKEATFGFVLRGYDGSNRPLWEHDVGTLQFGEQRAIRLADLQLPQPARIEGGILEVHAMHLHRPPTPRAPYQHMWIDGRGVAGGGYLIPTIPIRGATKRVRRDDLQVIPGAICTRGTDTEILVLNPVDVATEVELEAVSADGLTAAAELFVIEPWSSWRSLLSDSVPRARKLFAPAGGLGSVQLRSSHKTLPYFGFRVGDDPLTSLDHAAPIFA